MVSNFIRQALDGEEITIFGDGTDALFCYRDDLIEGIVRMMNAPDDCIEPINLGNPDEFTILELAQLVIELTGSKSKLIYKPAHARRPVAAAAGYYAGPQAARVGAAHQLRDGLRQTIEWFRSIDLHITGRRRRITEKVEVRKSKFE